MKSKQIPDDLDAALTTSQAAGFLGYSERTLAGWRMDGKGPKFYGSGNRVFYRKRRLIEFQESQERQSTSETRELSAASGQDG